MIDVTWNRNERSIEYYRDRHHVAVFGLFEQGALVNWSIYWNGKSRAGRWPKRKQSNTKVGH